MQGSTLFITPYAYVCVCVRRHPTYIHAYASAYPFGLVSVATTYVYVYVYVYVAKETCCFSRTYKLRRRGSLRKRSIMHAGKHFRQYY
jgi:hypothetical protein